MRTMRSNELFREIEGITKEISGRLKDYFENVDIPKHAVRNNGTGFSPKADLSEDIQNYYVQIELPGVKKEEITLTTRGKNAIEIAGKKDSSVLESGRTLISGERKFGSFKRVIELSSDSEIDTEKISANFQDGVLTVVLPKKGTNVGYHIEIN